VVDLWGATCVHSDERCRCRVFAETRFVKPESFVGVLFR
jgi:hypothetical protein